MVIPADARGTVELGNIESVRSGVSWAAIVGGAVAAVAVSIILFSLGSALGFASISPWANAGATLTSIGVGAAIWVVVTQWLASAFGGYLTGRMRTKWAVLGADEVFFRDTAHGFLAWALATLFMAWLVMSVAGGAANVAATVGAGAAQGATSQMTRQADPTAYFVDTLFRPAPNAPAAEGATTTPNATGGAAAGMADASEARSQTSRILTRAMSADLSPADRTYVGQLVASRTGLSQADAEKRVDEVITAAKQDADAARRAAATAAFLTALSLVIGAFVASVAGALGGRQRDEL